ncbi:unnamed protein product, partial [Urochloa humidicola]
PSLSSPSPPLLSLRPSLTSAAPARWLLQAAAARPYHDARAGGLAGGPAELARGLAQPSSSPEFWAAPPSGGRGGAGTERAQPQASRRGGAQAKLVLVFPATQTARQLLQAGSPAPTRRAWGLAEAWQLRRAEERAELPARNRAAGLLWLVAAGAAAAAHRSRGAPPTAGRRSIRAGRVGRRSIRAGAAKEEQLMTEVLTSGSGASKAGAIPASICVEEQQRANEASPRGWPVASSDGAEERRALICSGLDFLWRRSRSWHGGYG